MVHHRNGDLSPVKANTTRAARVGIPQANSGAAARPHDQSEHLTCGNDDRGQPGSSCRPGPDGGIRTAALHRLAGMVTASRCCPEVPAPQPKPPRTSPDDLAAELNPHKAVEAASRARTDRTGLPSSGQSSPARQLAKAGLSRRPRSAVPMTLRYRRGPSLRTRSRLIKTSRCLQWWLVCVYRIGGSAVPAASWDAFDSIPDVALQAAARRALGGARG